MLFSAVIVNIPNSKVCVKGEWSIESIHSNCVKRKTIARGILGESSIKIEVMQRRVYYPRRGTRGRKRVNRRKNGLE